MYICMYTPAEDSMASERVEAQHNPPAIQGRGRPTHSPPTAMAHQAVRDLDLLPPSP